MLGAILGSPMLGLFLAGIAFRDRSPPNDEIQRRCGSRMVVRTAVRSDADILLELRCALWPDSSVPQHQLEMERYFAEDPNGPKTILLAEDDRGSVVGFAELSIRAFAEGCETDRVAYLEGWFVQPGVRRRGVGRTLLKAVEDWGRSLGCSELASDADVDNALSAIVHRSLGFADVGLVRCFSKDL
jgi:aminoglycoside 6'-N-acetyltransferase I